MSLDTTPKIVGLQPERLILGRSTFSKTAAGLERISDTYYCRTVDFDYFVPVFRNGRNRKLITGYLQGQTASFGEYEEMTIEFVEYDNQVGGVSKFIVTFVGKLKKTSLDSPIFTTTPIEKTQYIHTPYITTVEWTESIGEPGSAEEVSFLLTYQVGNIVPLIINGTPIPGNTAISPYGLRIDHWINRFIPNYTIPKDFDGVMANLFASSLPSSPFANLGFTAGYYLIASSPAPENAPNDPVPRLSFIQYKGFAIRSFSFARTGKFASAIMSYSDSATAAVYRNANGVGGQATVSIP